MFRIILAEIHIKIQEYFNIRENGVRAIYFHQQFTYHGDGWFWIRFEKNQTQILHCLPHLGIGREEAAYVKRVSFYSGRVRVVAHKRTTSVTTGSPRITDSALCFVCK